MKKPLLLLVDDDPSTLAALEIEMTRRFEQVCRVEAFDDPREVIAALPRWEEEKRRVAVAVVDQMMFGMTGVELLTTLRTADPTSRMRSILLTGYAGLESALMAVNRAGAARYFEKPWKAETLITAVGELLGDHLNETGELVYLIQQVANDPVLLADVFRLRYSVYRMTPGMGMFLVANADEADIGPHDRHGIILALHRQEGGSLRLVGTMRLVQRGNSPYLSSIRQAARQLPIAGQQLDVEARPQFPMIGMFPAMETLIQTLQSKGAVVMEAGRHAILPEARGGATDRRQLEGTAAFLKAHDGMHVIAGIPLLHRRHYVPLGFSPVPGVEPSDALPGGALAIWSSHDRIHADVKHRVEVLAERLGKSPEKSTLCFCASYPDCIPDGYLSGDFSALDVYCPKAAQTLADRKRSVPADRRPMEESR